MSIHESSHSRYRFERGLPIPLDVEVISMMLLEEYPMIMVDRIIHYTSQPLPQLIAERYISANDHAFIGHFPGLKIWPGVLTLEGLNQSCRLVETLYRLEESNMLDRLFSLQKVSRFQQRFDRSVQVEVEEALKKIAFPQPLKMKLGVKLLAPVFAGCLVEYHVQQIRKGERLWTVQARVDGRHVAKGEISWGRSGE